VEGVNSTTIYLIHCKDFRKWHNVPPPSTTIKKTFILFKGKLLLGIKMWYNYI
jgi:hypothetical protein